ncbi:D-amino-acid oxidase [Mucor ambiguus]|uniref:D-amino-acid oxidase n=1 Tax=Mucor ambiguus TaxID=91626 RepID=A0A0C9MP66_9FUNG|nr:D-amino-acid oxidase [Mucor ambiguus]
MIDTSKPIVVLGAGVIGLSTALQLKQKGYKNVMIVAKYVPGNMCIEYTSPFAGAHWRTMAPNNNPLLKKFDTVTYNRFMELTKSSENSGIMAAPSYDYYDDAELPENADPWFQDLVQDFEILTEKDDLPHGAKIGHKYTTVLINTPVYIAWLAAKFEELGGEIVQRNVGHIDEVFNIAKNPFVINCTGLGARFLGGVSDEAVFPTRGQTIVIKAPHIKRTITHMGAQGITYVIPRSDGTVILGGTADKHDFNPFPEAKTNKIILEKTFALCPELMDKPLEIVKYNVGLRPSRIGGVRIENEIITSRNNKQKVQVTHAYGHGGFGVQSSWGSAEYIIETMEKGFPTSTFARL